MPKHKKSKTGHPKSNQLSQAEVWDDSALLRSWDDAVAEYQYYHSLQARGEDIDDVLRKAEVDEEADGEISEDGEIASDNVERDEIEDGEIEAEDSNLTKVHLTETTQNPTDVPQEFLNNDSHQTTQVPLMSSQTQGNGTDQTLENIKMAYYWAGYYSGLYDGQRQQIQGAPGTATNQLNAQNSSKG